MEPIDAAFQKVQSSARDARPGTALVCVASTVLTISDYHKETPLFTLYPCYAYLNQVP